MPRPIAASRERREEYLEIKKLCVIATEDSKTGGFEYFNELAEVEKYRFLRKYAFKLQIIPSVDGKTSPKQVLENLHEVVKRLHLNSGDGAEGASKEKEAETETDADADADDAEEEVESGGDRFWIVCDVDRWKPEHIDEVIGVCNDLKIDWAFSHPCFEIWILFHQEQFGDEIFSDSQECKKAANELLQKRKGFKNLITPQQIEYAVKRGEASHRPKSDLWPKSQGTHVYKIIKYLME